MRQRLRAGRDDPLTADRSQAAKTKRRDSEPSAVAKGAGDMGQVIGGLMIACVFAAMFVLAGLTAGWIPACLIFGGTAFVVVWISVGCWLLGKDGR